MDLLAELIERSLVEVEERDGRMRQRLLEVVRQYRAERLSAADEAERVHARHAQWCLRLAERAAPELAGPDQGRWLDLLEREHDNLRHALAWAFDERQVEICLRLGAALGGFWMAHGRLREGYRWLDTILASELETSAAGQSARAHVRVWAARLAWQLGLYERATMHAEAALALCRACGDLRSAAHVLNTLASLAQGRGEYAQAQALAEQSLALQRDLDDKPGVAASLKNLATMAQDRGEYSRAAALYQQSLALSREIGDRRSVAVALNNLGTVADGQGDHAYAVTLIQEGLTQFRELGEQRATAIALCDLAEALRHKGKYAEATAALDEALPRLRTLGDRLNTVLALTYRGAVALGQGDVQRARALGEEGLALSRELDDNRLVVGALTHLARVALRQGQLGRAEELAREAVTRYRTPGDRLRLAPSLEALAQVALAQRQPQRAARLLGAAEALRETIGMPASAAERTEHEQDVAALHAALGSRQCAKHWAAGRALPPEQVTAEAAVHQPTAPPPGETAQGGELRQAGGLGRRERQVAALVAGRTNRQIAAELGIAERTVATHVSRSLAKLGVTCRADIATWAHAQELQAPDDM